MTLLQTLLIVTPMLVIPAALLHWLTLLPSRDPEARMEKSRGCYLGLSLQLVIFSVIALGLAPGNSPARFLFPLGMAFSFLGDFFNLRFPFLKKRVEEPILFGVFSFMVAQVFFVAGFLSLVPMGELLSKGMLIPIYGVIVVVFVLMFKVRVWNPARPKALMASVLAYGFFLGAMAAVAIASAFARGGWFWLSAFGALSFLASDGAMGETSIHGRKPSWEYQVPWTTYLIAQACILGAVASMLG